MAGRGFFPPSFMMPEPSDRPPLRLLILGAGRVGRGFIAELFQEAGYAICFADLEVELVRVLNERKRYRVLKAAEGDSTEEFLVEGFEAIAAADGSALARRVTEASVIAVAVYPQALERAADLLAPALQARAGARPGLPVDVLMCANLPHPARLFRRLLCERLPRPGAQYLGEKVGIVDTLIMRICVDPPEEVRRSDPLAVLTNGYPLLVFDPAAFRGAPPCSPHLVAAANIDAEYVRKIFTYNMVHALLAYLGFARGHRYIHECLDDGGIRSVAEGALEEIGQALAEEYGFQRDEMERWNARVLADMSMARLRDEVARVGRDPARKLGREDRLTGAARLCRRHGIRPVGIARGIAHAFLFDSPQDEGARRVRDSVRQYGIEEAVRRLCGLADEPALVRLIADCYGEALG
jgi:mannitol-1-phosphate 5-dehydrogenase